MLRIENGFKEYKNGDIVTPVLHGISFRIQKGEFVALMGPSGSGKSTLMHILGFLDRFTSGSYEFDNQNVAHFSDDALAALRKTHVGFIFQAFHLLPNSQVIENVMLPLVYAQISQSDRRIKAQKALEAVGLSHRLDHLSNQLSGGERQRVAIARALVNEPQVIFADEPTGNLDTKSGAVVLGILQQLNEEFGRTIVMVTHELEAAQHAQRILRLRDGEMIADESVLMRRKGEYHK